MKRVLIYYKYLNIHDAGGGIFEPLMFISELQKSCDVTLALYWLCDIDSVSRQLNIQLDAKKLRIVAIKPMSTLLSKLDAIIPFYRTYRLKKLSKEADICISTINTMDFGKPAHHFIIDTGLSKAFGEYALQAPKKSWLLRIRDKFSFFVAENILRPLLSIRSTKRIINDPKEHIYPNSFFMNNTMKNYYGVFNSTVFYPPTIFEFNTNSVVRNPLRVIYIGRIEPEKRIVELVGIVERARSISGSAFELCVAGSLPNTPYGYKLKQLACAKKWLKLIGSVQGKEKEKFMLQGAFAVHTRRDEPFGIAVTEYLKAGIVVLVPSTGGACEIVNSKDLTYTTDEDAAVLLARLSKDASFYHTQLEHCTQQAKFFSLQSYLDRQHELLHNIINIKD